MGFMLLAEHQETILSLLSTVLVSELFISLLF